MNTAVSRLLAEFAGTALLVLGGVGTAVLAPQVGPVGIALAFGLSLLVLVYVLGPISGCHLNPAVTLGMALSGRLPGRDAAGYVVSQIVGAIAGSAVVYLIASNRSGYRLASDGLGANGWGTASSGGYGLRAALVVEVVLTALLVFTVLTVTATTNLAAVAGLPIGLVLVLCHLVAIPIDGTSVNPARSIGSALFAGHVALGQLWLFVVVPLVGGALAALVHRALRPSSPDLEYAG
ncbi:aquaporin Z [Nakamurella sp. UYEF19]|uniref:aquaporin n=1 Tax=Nakamurella sp. UYEF19 TaxID=1756392 RepID=UPI00339B6C22